MGLDGEARQRLTATDATATIGGSVGRTPGHDVGRTLRGFGGVTPVLARGGDKIPADLYGLH